MLADADRTGLLSEHAIGQVCERRSADMGDFARCALTLGDVVEEAIILAYALSTAVVIGAVWYAETA